MHIGSPSARSKSLEQQNHQRVSTTIPVQNLPPEIVCASEALRQLVTYRTVDRLTSRLGHHNPFVHSVNEDDIAAHVYNVAAYRAEADKTWQLQQWETSIKVLLSRANPGVDVTTAMKAISDVSGQVLSQVELECLRKHLRTWTTTFLPAHIVDVQLSPITISEADRHTNERSVTRLNAHSTVSSTFQIGPSNKHGLAKNVVSFPDQDYTDYDLVRITPVACNSPSASFVIPCASRGWTICCGVDDVLKEVNLYDIKLFFRNTFFREDMLVEGMPGVMKELRGLLKNPAIFYSSSTPLNFYPRLRTFLDSLYPRGMVITRDESCKDFVTLLSAMTVDVGEFKLKWLEKIYAQFPNRKLLCIGNSFGRDAEIYSEMHRRHPSWIQAILIRRTRLLPQGSSDSWSTGEVSSAWADRAFQGVPRDKWLIFEDPHEIVVFILHLLRS